MDDQVFFDQFHATYDIEPRAGSFEQLRTTLIATQTLHGSRSRFRIELPRMGVKVVAVLALVVLAIASAGAFIAINQYVHHTVPVQPPRFRVMAPGAAVCHDTCTVGSPVFLSADVGWLSEDVTTCKEAYCSNKSVLFRTDDQGLHWKAKLTWSQPFDQILASPDGRQVLIFTLQKVSGPPLLYSADGGESWASNGYPTGTAQPAAQPSAEDCQTGKGCPQGPSTLTPLAYFLNPREGWALLPNPSSGFAQLYQTIDGGGHWQPGIQIDVKTQFNLDSLQGRLIFVSALIVWLVPYRASPSMLPNLYRSLDGGKTWHPQSVQSPAGTDLTTVSLTPQIFNDREGIVEIVARPLSGASANGMPEAVFVSTTSDGGDHWSIPIKVSDQAGSAALDYIDSQHWVQWTSNGDWLRTSNSGQHWESLPANGPHQLPRAAPYCVLPPCFPHPPGSFHFVTASLGWAALYEPPTGGQGSPGTALYETTDGGINWIPLRLPELS